MLGWRILNVYEIVFYVVECHTVHPSRGTILSLKTRRRMFSFCACVPWTVRDLWSGVPALPDSANTLVICSIYRV
jgi:hypothetical protein